MPRVPFAQRTLSRLRDFGVLISLDDFGTGYSCLSYLHEFPVTTLKIDRSFIDRIGMPNERPEIVRAIVSLAHTLGIEVTAEGVETAAQLERIRLLECEHAQGFFLSQPLTAAAAELFLRRHEQAKMATRTSPCREESGDEGSSARKTVIRDNG